MPAIRTPHTDGKGVVVRRPDDRATARRRARRSRRPTRKRLRPSSIDMDRRSGSHHRWQSGQHPETRAAARPRRPSEDPAIQTVPPRRVRAVSGGAADAFTRDAHFGPRHRRRHRVSRSTPRIRHLAPKVPRHHEQSHTRDRVGHTVPDPVPDHRSLAKVRSTRPVHADATATPRMSQWTDQRDGSPRLPSPHRFTRSGFWHTYLPGVASPPFFTICPVFRVIPLGSR
jgi:hypothetical protein